MTDVPQFPIGEFKKPQSFDQDQCLQLIEELEQAPDRLKQAVTGLNDEQLDTRYKNWTIRQIVHHIADSHVNSYIRFKWTLTEKVPLIKAYNEADWVATKEAATADVGAPLAMLSGVHTKWCQLLRNMDRDDYLRSFRHPETEQEVQLWEALNYYPWHARHHTGQILWLRNHNGWA